MSELSTTTGKSIGDYEDYHDGHSDVAYFESDAVIPLAGKYAASDEAKTTKSVKLATVLGGGSAPAAGGGIELNNGELQLQSINGAAENQVPYKTNNGIGWKEPAKVIHGNGVNVSSGAGFSVSANLTAQGGLSFDDGADGQKGIKVDNPVPAPGTNEHRGQILTVNNSDQVVWDNAPTTAVPIDGTTITKNASDELQVANPVPSATGHNEGDVLTISNGGIGWVAPQGGGGGSGLPDASLLANAKTSYGDKLSEDTETFDENTDYEMRYHFIPTAMNQDGSIHTYKIKWYVKAGSGGFETTAVGSGSFN